MQGDARVREEKCLIQPGSGTGSPGAAPTNRCHLAFLFPLGKSGSTLEAQGPPGENSNATGSWPARPTYRIHLGVRMFRYILAALFAAALSSSLYAEGPAARSDAENKAIARIRQLGGLVLDVAQNDPHLEVSYLQTDGKFSDDYLAPLKELKQLVHLNLRGQPVTDAQLAYLKDLSSLTELHLENTKITDAGLPNLRGLVNLEYLNLYGTAVTDAGLVNLEGMKKLKHLYLWQTKVTETGAVKLKKAIPTVEVNRGVELEKKPDVKPAEEKKPEEKKPAEKKPEEKKTPEKKPEEKKAPDKKTEEKKPEEKKSK